MVVEQLNPHLPLRQSLVDLILKYVIPLAVVERETDLRRSAHVVPLVIPESPTKRS